ncbi:MAG: transcriptional regulator [Anaerolineales bacterium]|nr:transcriptional regulator [Anaerolineales bacterium]
MEQPYKALADLDRLIHDPARLSILTILQKAAYADFLFLQRVTGLTPGNLSGHLTKLEEGGMVRVEKQFVGKKPRTVVRLTGKGREAIDRHWRNLETLHKRAQDWQPEDTDPGAEKD